MLFPDVSTWDDLREALLRERNGHSVHLYYGSAERHYREQFAGLSGAGEHPAWLTLEARGQDDAWSLYRVEP